MANEISTYLNAVQAHLTDAYAGWSFVIRGEANYNANRAWFVELGFEGIDDSPQAIEWDGYGARMRGAFTATVWYQAKAPTHRSFIQANEITMTLASYMMHRQVKPGEVFVVKDVSLLSEVDDEGMDSGTYVGTIAWTDIFSIDSDITIEGYVTQSPTGTIRPDTYLGYDLEGVDVTLEAV